MPLNIGDKVKFRSNYEGYFSNLKGMILTVKSICFDENKQKVTLNEIKEIHLVATNSLIEVQND